MEAANGMNSGCQTHTDYPLSWSLAEELEGLFTVDEARKPYHSGHNTGHVSHESWFSSLTAIFLTAHPK